MEITNKAEKGGGRHMSGRVVDMNSRFLFVAFDRNRLRTAVDVVKNEAESVGYSRVLDA